MSGTAAWKWAAGPARGNYGIKVAVRASRGGRVGWQGVTGGECGSVMDEVFDPEYADDDYDDDGYVE